MTAFPKIEPDAETLELEREFMGVMGTIRERLAGDVEHSLLTVLEENLCLPISTKTAPRYKITECDGEMIFTLLAFEAKIDA